MDFPEKGASTKSCMDGTGERENPVDFSDDRFYDTYVKTGIGDASITVILPDAKGNKEMVVAMFYFLFRMLV